MEFDSPLDTGIARYVEVLRAAGIETFESCQGGAGHCYPAPTVRFHGHRSEGFKAVAVALQHALPVSTLRRIWPIIDGEPTGPYWEMTFSRMADGGTLAQTYGQNHEQMIEEWFKPKAHP